MECQDTTVSHGLGLAWSLDLPSRTFRSCERIVRLTHREVAILDYFTSRAGQIVATGDLLAAIWNITLTESHATSRKNRAQVNRAIQRLRAKIEVDPDQPRCIVTAYGVGFIAPLEERVEVEQMKDGNGK